MRIHLIAGITAFTLACLATPALAEPPAAAPAAGATQHLGSVDVKGMQHLAEALQEIKVAIKRPLGNDPEHFDDMVCSLEVDRAHGILDCGTQGYYSMQRDQSLYGNGFGTGAVAIVTLGHPWHVVRDLNMKQVQALRLALKEVPAPGKGQVQVTDDTAPMAPAK